MEQEPKPAPKNGNGAEGPSRKSGKKSAKVVCASNNVFWTTPKQFWTWAKEGIVTYQSDNPLTGKFEGRREKLLVMINHILLDDSVPDHKAHVLNGYHLQKRKRPQYPKPPVRKRAR
jgi:hypothetical protein